MARSMGERSQLAAVFETTYGTAPASGFFRMPHVGFTLGRAQPLIASGLLGYGRDQLPSDKDVQTVSGEVTVPVDADSFGMWLRATMGSPTTAGSGPYTHTFESGSWALPSLAIEAQLPEVPHFGMITGAKVDTLSFTAARAGGLLTATVGLIAQAEAVASSTAAGSLTDWALSPRFTGFSGVLSRDATALGNVVSVSVELSNSLEAVEVLRTDGAIAGADPGMFMASGQLVTRFDAQTLRAQAIADGVCSLVLAFTSGTDSLTITAHEVKLSTPRAEVSGPGGVQMTFDWRAQLDVGEGHALDVVLVNGVETY